MVSPRRKKMKRSKGTMDLKSASIVQVQESEAHVGRERLETTDKFGVVTNYKQRSKHSRPVQKTSR